MKRLCVLCLAAAAMTSYAVGQEVVQQSVTESQSATVPQHLGLETVVGCLTKTAGTYVLTGGAPGAKQFRIISGDVSSLKGKIEQTIEVVGIVAKNDAAANQNDLYNEGTTTGVGYLTIKAEKIKRLFGNCSEAGKEWEGDRMK